MESLHREPVVLLAELGARPRDIQDGLIEIFLRLAEDTADRKRASDVGAVAIPFAAGVEQKVQFPVERLVVVDVVQSASSSSQ